MQNRQGRSPGAPKFLNIHCLMKVVVVVYKLERLTSVDEAKLSQKAGGIVSFRPGTRVELQNERPARRVQGRRDVGPAATKGTRPFAILVHFAPFYVRIQF